MLAFAGAIVGGALGFQLSLFGKLGALHQGFGIAVMALASLQVSAILLRPNKVVDCQQALYSGITGRLVDRVPVTVDTGLKGTTIALQGEDEVCIKGIMPILTSHLLQSPVQDADRGRTQYPIR